MTVPNRHGHSSVSPVTPLQWPSEIAGAGTRPLSIKEERVVLHSVDRQLRDRARHGVPDNGWDGLESTIADLIGSVCAEVSGWPNALFIRDDPFLLMTVEDMCDVDLR